MVLRGIRVTTGQSYKNLEAIAAKIRRVLAPGIDVDQALPAFKVFQFLGQFTIRAGGVSRRVRYAVQDGLGYGVEALTRYDREADAFDVVLDGRTYDAVESTGEGRCLFTLPHEIGHLVLHKEELLKLATIPHHRALMRGAGEHKPCFDSEWQANNFSAPFAMPAEGLARLEARGMLNAFVVQATFKVSAEAAAFRVENFLARRHEFMAGAALARSLAAKAA
jgi:hypothetical protein